jgi:pimeloyl-ACP methyl ester carboxylesterase
MPVAWINDHEMYYEVHGSGVPLLCMTGWGTFCHGNTGLMARGLLENYQCIAFDHRGLGLSGDNYSQRPTMRLYADDAAGLLDHLGLANVHIVGLVGMGACIGQEMAINRPDLVRSMTNMGAWAHCDPYLHDMLEMLREVHRAMGWAEFQKQVTVLSFLPEFYNQNKARLLGPDGGWAGLYGRYEAHSRLIDACLSHDTRERLHLIQAPSLILHAGQDKVNPPRTTLPLEEGIPNARGVLMEDVAHVVAGKEQKKRFCEILLGFLAEVDAATEPGATGTESSR